MNGNGTNQETPDEAAQGITAITVRGFKSLRDETRLEIRPLTLLAGANSSGKSSAMQPLLLMKQTLEADYDPGALLLDGPNVHFTSSEQLLSRDSSGNLSLDMSFGMEVGEVGSFKNTFMYHANHGFELLETQYLFDETANSWRFGMTHEEITALQTPIIRELNTVSQFHNINDSKFTIARDRILLRLGIFLSPNPQPYFAEEQPALFRFRIADIIHVPGLRGNPERTYRTSGISNSFSGTFEHYVASIISILQDKPFLLLPLSRKLELLGLTGKVEAVRLDDTRVEIRVGRLPKGQGDEKDMVSIADVGFGVSQTLPVLVALLVAKPGQLVYIEQPELHLHPRAQTALAQVLVDAANRGVRVVAETHSSLLLLGVQTAVAEGKIAPDKVKLHWFQRGEDGFSKVTSADLDESGTFGDWPEDFADVELHAQSRFLDAAEARMGLR